MTAGEPADVPDAGSFFVVQPLKGKVVAREATPMLFRKLRLPFFIPES
jgi:hypothetical protein